MPVKSVRYIAPSVLISTLEITGEPPDASIDSTMAKVLLLGLSFDIVTINPSLLAGALINFTKRTLPLRVRYTPVVDTTSFRIKLLFVCYKKKKGKKKMNEKLKLKNDKEFPLVVDGINEFQGTLTLTFQADDALENLITEFSAANTEQIKVLNTTGETLSVYDGYTVLGDPKSVNETAEIQPASYNDDGSVKTEAVIGRAVTMILSKPGVVEQVKQNRADIDFLAVMTGTDL